MPVLECRQISCVRFLFNSFRCHMSSQYSPGKERPGLHMTVLLLPARTPGQIDNCKIVNTIHYPKLF